jgi:putative Holliday junction resolvase
LAETGIIALDVGDRRVGVAGTDPLGLTAQPLVVLQRQPHKRFLADLKELIDQREAKLIVMGLPTKTDGSHGRESQKILALAYELRTLLGHEVVTYDESFTSIVAEEILKEAGLKHEKRQKVVDKLAATFILEGYLASKAEVGLNKN